MNLILSMRKMTMHELAKRSDVSLATINDLCNGRTRVEKCSAETRFRIAKVLGVSMESLIIDAVKSSADDQPSFEQFKSNIRHQVKYLGDLDFVAMALKADQVRHLFKQKRYPESLYLLAMVDYLSKENNLPLYNQYNDLRTCKLNQPVYPASINAAYAASHDEKWLTDSIKASLPEFMRYNIVETDVRDVA